MRVLRMYRGTFVTIIITCINARSGQASDANATKLSPLDIRNNVSNTSYPTAIVRNIFAEFENCLKEAIEHIRSGKVIAIPTDTVYGLAVDAENANAVQKLYRIKERVSSKAVAICVHEVQAMNQWGHVDHLPESLLNELLPGPVTVVVNRTSTLSSELNPNDHKVAIRVPKHNFVQKLTAALRRPIALSSANKSGDKSSVAVEEFLFLWSLLDAVFDGGTIGSTRAGSTIVDLSSRDSEYKIIRAGDHLNSTLRVLSKYGFKKA